MNKVLTSDHALMLTSLQVGIIGMGRIGIQVTKRLRGFDCTVLYPGTLSHFVM